MGKTAFSGPVAGHYMMIPVVMNQTVTDGNATYLHNWNLPIGMTFKLMGFLVTCETVSGPPAFLAGWSGDVDAYRTSTDIVADSPRFYPCNGASANADGTVDLTGEAMATSNANDWSVSVVYASTEDSVMLSIWAFGFVTGHPSSFLPDD